MITIHYSENFVDAGSWTYIDFGVSGMYHFVLDNKKWDPFLGLVLGYEVATWKWNNALLLVTTAHRPVDSLSAAAQALDISSATIGRCRLGLDFGFYIFAVGVDYKF